METIVAEKFVLCAIEKRLLSHEMVNNQHLIKNSSVCKKKIVSIDCTLVMWQANALS